MRQSLTRTAPATMAIASRATVLRQAASLLLLPLALSPPPAHADGLDFALKACPDTRIVCFSSFDPTHFLEAWQYKKGERGQAISAMSAELKRLGGTVETEDGKRGTALFAKFTDSEAGRTDSTIIWFPADENVIHFRSERVDEPVWDGNANKNRLKLIRSDLNLENYVRDLTAEDMYRVGRNSEGQIAEEREALQAQL